MRIFRIVLAIGALAIGALAWIYWPVYGFFAFNGDAPMPPFGWLQLESDAPSDSTTYDASYAASGEQALLALQEHRARIGAPAMSAAVAIKGELVWAGAVGWADVRSGTPATPDTIFRVGSTSKAMTATALARLVQRGVIDLDAPISTYCDELPNPAWAEITPRQLASHVAGMPHYGENTDQTGLYKSVALADHYPDVRDALSVFDSSELIGAPGEKFFYSSLGTVLLGATMSEAAGASYRQLMADEVFEPAGAASTIVSPRRSAPTDEIATPYFLGENRVRAWRAVDLSHRLPGGGWASTPSDLVRIGALWLDDDFITPATRATFWAPQRLNDGSVNEQNYALGWRWREAEGSNFWLANNANHGGVSRGGQAWLMVFPDDDMVLAFTINAKTEEFSDFGDAYADLYRAFAEN